MSNCYLQFKFNNQNRQKKLSFTKLMTSSFTKKQRDDTVSQTGKRSLNQVSQISNHDQATNDNTNLSFDLQVQNLMPLIQHLKQENEQLKHERDQIQNELTKLKSLSEGVLEENHLMKQHYQQRTDDIRKIVATMSINMNEEIEDINHMIHMTKNHNFAIVKNIQKAKKEISQKSEEVQHVQNQLAELAQKNTFLQEEIITRNVKIRQMEQKMEEVQEQRLQEDNLFKLEEQVDKLVQEVKVLRDVNVKKLKNTQTIQTRNQIDKPHYTAQNINVIQTIKALTQQLTQLREDSQAFQKNLQNLKNYHSKVAEKCQKANQQREHQTLEIQGQQNEIKNQKQRIFTNKSKQKEKQVTKSELEDEKYRLQKEITRRQQKIEKIKKDQYFQLQSKKKEFKQKSNRQKMEYNVEVQKNYDQLTFKLNPEKEKKLNALNELRQEHDDLEKEVEEMKTTIKNMDNPVKEIIRLEYELKRLKN